MRTRHIREPVSDDQLDRVETPQHVGELLRQAIEHAGRSLRDLQDAAADHLGVEPPAPGLSRSGIGDMTKGRYLDDDRLRLVVSLCGVPNAQLVKWSAACDRVGGRRPRGIDTLPRDVTLIGRDYELQRITDIAAASGIIAISGMPGIGKTAFATRLAHRLADRYPDGRLFVDLHAHTRGRTAATPSEVLAGLLIDLGLDSREIPDSLENRRNLWRKQVAGKRFLLVLDNARDHAQVEPLLPSGPDCLTLITSRRTLVALDGAEPFDLDALEPDRAAALFCTLAHRTPSGGDPAAVAEIVRLCGYLPLAIVLIAGRAANRSAWGVAEIAAELASARDPLREFEAGERAVRAAFAMSYRDMPPDRRLLFRRLGVHPGRDIDKYAAAALADIPVAAAGHELEALFTEHLLQEQADGRYRMHDLLRVYAHDHAATEDPADDRDAAVDRVLDYYRRVGELANRQLTVDTRSRELPVNGESPAAPSITSRLRALAWLRAERDNLLDCLEHAVSHGRSSQAIELTGALAGLLRIDGPWPVAVDLHRRAAALAEEGGDPLAAAEALYNLGTVQYATGDYAGAVGPMRQALTIFRARGDRAAEARALGVLGALAYATGDYPATAELMLRASTRYGEIGDGPAAAYALIGLGMARYATGDYPVAANLVRQALAVFTDSDDRLGKAYALNELGMIEYATGDYCGATHTIERALAAYLELGDRVAEAHALNDLASVRFATGDYPVATKLAQQAFEICRDVRDRVGEAYARTNLARLHFATTDWPAAIDDMTEALTIFEEIGDRVGAAYAVDDLSWAQYTSGDFSATIDQMTRALGMFEDIGDRVGQAYTLVELGLAWYASGDYPTAAEPMQRALTIFEALGDRVGQAYVRCGLGRLCLAMDDHPGADELLRQALAIFRAIGDRVGEAYVLSSLARLSYATDNDSAAEDLVWQAVQIYRTLGDRFGHAYALGGAALLRYAADDPHGAIAPAQEAMRIFDDIGDRACHAYAFVGVGLLRYADGDQSGAIAMVEQAPPMFREFGDRIGEAYAFVGAGLLRFQSGDYEDMANLAQRALAIFREIREQPRRAELLERISRIWEESSTPQDAVVSYIDALRLAREIQIRWKKRRVWRDLPISAAHR